MIAEKWHQFLLMRLEPSASLQTRTAFDRAVADTGNPCAVQRLPRRKRCPPAHDPQPPGRRLGQRKHPPRISRLVRRSRAPPSRSGLLAGRGHHGLARTIEVPTRDATAAPPSGAPRLRLGPLLTVDTPSPPPNPHSAPPPRPIRRQPHQLAGLAHVRLAIRSRTLPIEPPQVPVLAARARRDHELLLRHQSCRCVSSPSASRRPRTASSGPSPTLTTRVP